MEDEEGNLSPKTPKRRDDEKQEDDEDLDVDGESGFVADALDDHL